MERLSVVRVQFADVVELQTTTAPIVSASQCQCRTITWSGIDIIVCQERSALPARSYSTVKTSIMPSMTCGVPLGSGMKHNIAYVPGWTSTSYQFAWPSEKRRV